jgi:hypothetical protein
MPSHLTRKNGISNGTQNSGWHQWLRSFKQFLRLGVTAIILGALLILLSLYLTEVRHPTGHFALVGIAFLSHLGIALLVLGIIGIMIDLPDWQLYFQERIKATIIEKDFLNSLSQPELMSLTTNSLKSYFKVEDLDEKESFLEYFQAKILGFIASPYREDTHGIIHLEYSSRADVFLVQDHTSYKCRKVGKYIQPEVSWYVEPDEIDGELEGFEVILRLPENFFLSPEFTVKYPDFLLNTLTIRKGDDRLLEAQDGLGYSLPLNDFREIDGLSVAVNVKYRAKSAKFLYWYMVYPSKGLLFTLHYPRELTLWRLVFGLNRNTTQEDSLPGLYSLRSDSWLLPNDGVAYQLLRTPVELESNPVSGIATV